jgi:hypothetical protein
VNLTQVYSHLVTFAKNRNVFLNAISSDDWCDKYEVRSKGSSDLWKKLLQLSPQNSDDVMISKIFLTYMLSSHDSKKLRIMFCEYSKLVAVFDWWLLFRGSFRLWCWKIRPQKVGRRSSLVQVWMYCESRLI